MTTTTETSKADPASAGIETYVLMSGFGKPSTGPTIAVSAGEFRISMSGVEDGYFSDDHVQIGTKDGIAERGPHAARQIAECVYAYLMSAAADRTKVRIY